MLGRRKVISYGANGLQILCGKVHPEPCQAFKIKFSPKNLHFRCFIELWIHLSCITLKAANNRYLRDDVKVFTVYKRPLIQRFPIKIKVNLASI